MKTNIYKMYIINLVKNMMFFSAVTVPFFLDWAKIDYTRIFILEASFSFFMFVLEIPTGIIADKYGRKYSLALGGIFGAASFILFGLVNNYRVFFLADFICALGFTLMSGADKALLYDTLIAAGEEEKAVKYFSRYETAGIAGIIMGLIGGSVIADSPCLPYPSGLPLTFILSGAVLLAVFIVAMTLREPARKKSNEKFLRQGINGLQYIFRNGRLRAFSLNYTFISATTFFMFWLYQPLLKSAGIGLAYYGLVGAAFNIFSILLMNSVGRIEGAVGVNRLLFLTAFIPGLLYCGLYFPAHAAYALPAILLVVGLRQMRSPLLSDYMNQHIGSGNRATVLSGVSMIERVIIMIMYPVTGLLADHSLAAAFLFLGAVTVIFSFIVKVEADAMA